MRSKYQRYPDIEGAAWEEFKADIQKNGVQVAAVYDETGEIIDGHQRVRACRELGIECPKSIAKGLTEEEKIKLADTLNLKRRHLTPEQRIERRDRAEEEYQQLRREAEDATRAAKQAEQEAKEAARKAQEAKDEEDRKQKAQIAAEAKAKAAEAKAKAAETKAAQATREEVAEKYGTTAKAMERKSERENPHGENSANATESKDEASVRYEVRIGKHENTIRMRAYPGGVFITKGSWLTQELADKVNAQKFTDIEELKLFVKNHKPEEPKPEESPKQEEPPIKNYTLKNVILNNTEISLGHEIKRFLETGIQSADSMIQDLEDFKTILENHINKLKRRKQK